MPLQALQKFEEKIERQLRFLEIRKHIIERKFGRQIRLFEQKRDDIGKKIEERIRQFELKRGIRLDDEVRFIRSWIERPLSTGERYRAVKVLHEPSELRRRLSALGWQAEIHTVGWRFFYATAERTQRAGALSSA